MPAVSRRGFFNGMFGFAVFGDVPSPSTIVGAVIIIGAGFYIFLREQQLGRTDAVVSPPV